MADLKFSGLSEMGAADNSYLLPVSDDTTASEKKTFTPPLIDLFNNAEVAHSSIATLTSADLGKTIALSGSTFTLTLMTAVGVTGRIIDFLPDSGAAGTYTLDGSGAQTIGGSTTIDVIDGDFLRLRSDGANWQIIVNVGSNTGGGGANTAASTFTSGNGPVNIGISGTGTYMCWGTATRGTSAFQFISGHCLIVNATISQQSTIISTVDVNYTTGFSVTGGNNIRWDPDNVGVSTDANKINLYIIKVS